MSNKPFRQRVERGRSSADFAPVGPVLSAHGWNWESVVVAEHVRFPQKVPDGGADQPAQVSVVR